MSIEFTPSSWQRAGQALSDLGPSLQSMLQDLGDSTTDANACGAAQGLSTVDGAITIALTAMQTVMTQVAEGFGEALNENGASMIATGDDYESVEIANTDVAQSLWSA